MNVLHKRVSSSIYTGKAEAVKWFGIKIMLKYSDLFEEGRRVVNIAAWTQLFLCF